MQTTTQSGAAAMAQATALLCCDGMKEQESRNEPFLSGGAYLDVRYSESRAPRGRYPDLLARELVRRAYGRPGRLLDLGCGRGDQLAAFHRLGFDVAGVDVSERAPGLAAGLPVEVVDLERDPLPFPDESFDFVFSKSVLEHLHEPAAVVAKARAALRPGGVAVFMTPSWEHSYRGPFYYEYSHVTPFTRQSLRLALEYAGLEPLEVSYFRQLPFLWRRPALGPLVAAAARLPLRYRPYHEVPWPDAVNKLVRFSKEVLLLGVARRA